MNITIKYEIDNTSITDFAALEEEMYQMSLAAGREAMRQVLELRDQILMATRDTERYRNKGPRATSIKTKLGVVEYERRVYVDLEAEGQTSCYLLDKDLHIDRIGQVSSSVCEIIAGAICTGSYRTVSHQLTKMTGCDLSPTGVWNIVQELGQREMSRVDRKAELAAMNAATGEVETPILYEEADGIYLGLQGESRKRHGKSKEMKVGIAYDGATWEVNGKGEKRRTLHNKTAYASFEPVKEFRKHNEAVVSSQFLMDSVEMVVRNGDGANWIQKVQTSENEDVVVCLDVFHRNKKILECIRDREFAKTLRSMFYEESTEPEDILECIEAQINSVEDDDEKLGVKTLLDYYSDNKGALLGYYDRGVEIPETSDPGVIHHARLGSMESNVFTLIGDRMKGGRRNWSISGGNNLALLLVLFHTVGLKTIFDAPVPLPDQEPEWVDEGRPLLHWENPQRVGHGYGYYNSGKIIVDYLDQIQNIDISVSKFL